MRIANNTREVEVSIAVRIPYSAFLPDPVSSCRLHPRVPMPSAPKKLRKQYVNSEHPVVVLRFEDGHEIVVKKGGGKTFDAYAGETIKVLAVYDKTSGERELVESRKADEFPDA
jgi:hypothetical protein